ncbi:hypothetical protein NQ314_010019 [Rhamnusium bicolor]|uniref:Uncharacterized protein n=1 Tax=Rhamnusium bicolor TaxID=1586634 RepID=A0AAV8XWE9_9CUCU|nr:hypothetical protein NQ314_010019 [Rhamnusium bicolor]
MKVGTPKLNKEIKAALTEAYISRDDRRVNIQNQIGASLSALEKALTILLGEEGSKDGTKCQMIELVSDAGRLLADIHHKNSETRRSLVTMKLNKKLKETLTDTSLDGWLFGDKLDERVKVAKAIEQSGNEQRQTTHSINRVQRNSAEVQENFKRPLRYHPTKTNMGRLKFKPRQRQEKERKRYYNGRKYWRTSRK